MSGPVGLFGGSFDPVHRAHLQLAQAALDSLHLTAIRWIPNGMPGHREGPAAGAADRLEMLRLALANEPRFVIDESELWQTSPTYTIDTLTRLRGELGAALPLVFIIGADHLLGFHRWREWEKLFGLAHFAVAGRPGHEIRADSMTPEVAAQYARRRSPIGSIAASPAGCIVEFPSAPMDISSRSIRSLLAAGSDAAGMLPAAVLHYIETKHLYRARP